MDNDNIKIGQIVYGFLFDRFSNMIYLCFIPTGVIVCAVGMSAMGFLKRWKKNNRRFQHEAGNSYKCSTNEYVYY